NYPRLIKGDSVDLNAARGKASLVNRATLGIFGREAQSFVPKNTQDANVVVQAAASAATSNELSSAQIKADVPAPSLDNAVQEPSVPSIGLGLPDQTSPQDERN
ncbi:hypothetical protein RJJ65_41365, partial [Rhizobium hidalgonense]